MYITVGCSGSGKSTWAKEIIDRDKGTVEINRDEIRFELFTGGVEDWSLYTFNEENERRVTVKQELRISRAVREGKDIIISDTNLEPARRDHLRGLVPSHYAVYEKVFNVPLETCLLRDKQRKKEVGEAVLRKQYELFAPYVHQQDYMANRLPHESANGLLLVDVDIVCDLTALDGMSFGILTSWKSHIVANGVIGILYPEASEKRAKCKAFLDALINGFGMQFLDNSVQYFPYSKKVGFPSISQKKEVYLNILQKGLYNIEYIMDVSREDCDMWHYETGLPVLQYHKKIKTT